MKESIEDFLHNLQQEISLSASEEGNERGLPEAFTEYMVEVLTEAGEIDDAQVASYQATGARASGFSLSDDETTLWLFLTDYRGDLTVQGLVKSDLDNHFKRMIGFLERTRGGLWKKLEESAPSWDMAQQLADAWDQVAEIRLVVLTNAALRTTVGKETTLDGRKVFHSVWDLTRLHKLASSGLAQEPISIDVVDVWGKPIPCLGPQGDPGTYDTYLMMLPGELIARIYEQHGPRLLELNVRSFLQSRGKVNQAIQKTIKDAPRRFLAYNNGISMTAAAVKVVSLPDGSRGISSISGLQIVNGGQTTASLHYAKVKSKVDLSDLYVQAKLSVVEPTLLMDLVPRISEFANSQNKVNMADFSANDPFHVEIERLSRSVWAPGKAGTGDMTRWFYERARGQYADAHARERTPAAQRKFKLVHPANQKFTKTDLAKFENTWDQLPWMISRGAEKNFREFMIRLRGRGSSFKPDQKYFEQLVAKAILFRSADHLVKAQKLGGYIAQTVNYTLAKLLNATGQRLDLDAIWREQELSPVLAAAIENLSPKIHAALIGSAGTRNITEWAKKEECWKAILDLEWQPPSSLAGVLTTSTSRTKTSSIASVGEQLNDEERTALDAVTAVSGDTWLTLSSWAKETGSLQPWQRGIAFSLGRMLKDGRIPSRKQAVQGALILAESRRLGFSGLGDVGEHAPLSAHESHRYLSPGNLFSQISFGPAGRWRLTELFCQRRLLSWR